MRKSSRKIWLILLALVAAGCSKTDVRPQPSVRVEADGRTVTAVDRDGKIRWSVDVIAERGEPFVGDPLIRDVKVEQERVNVVFGKHSFASIDIETGKVSYLGAD